GGGAAGGRRWGSPRRRRGGAGPAPACRTGSRRRRTPRGPMLEIRALVVDDEPPARHGLTRMLGAHRDIAVVGECRNGSEAVRAIRTTRPDLVFLDVEMPGLDGFGVLHALAPG